jgi:PAS domain-containing protein
VPRNAQGQPLEAVFRIVNESTREKVENPATRSLRDGVDRRAGESHLADQGGTARKRRSTTARAADPRPAGPGARLHPRLSRHQREEGCRAARSAKAQARLQRVVTDMAIRRWSSPTTARSFSSTPPGPGISGFNAAELTTIPAWTKHAYGARAEAMNEVIASLFDLAEAVDNGEREITTASGEKRIWHFVTVPLGRDGRGRRMLVTNAIDVTEQRRLDQVLAEKEARMRLAMERRTTAAGSGTGRRGEMVWTDKDARAARRRDPTSRSASSASSSASTPTTATGAPRAIAEAWVTGVHGNEYRIVRPDGEVRWVSSRGRVSPRPRRQRADARRGRRHHRAEEGGRGADGGRPQEGRIPRHPRARAAQSARAAAQLACGPAADGRRSGDVREGERRDGTPAQPPLCD